MKASLGPTPSDHCWTRTMSPIEGRQQALTVLESDEQERTLRGHAFSSKVSMAVLLLVVSTAAVKAVSMVVRTIVNGQDFGFIVESWL